MKPIEEITMDDRNDRRLDLLVDGELDENDRRELLCGLDDEPDGWRRSRDGVSPRQTWKQVLGTMVGAAAESEEKPAPRRPPGGSGTRKWPWPWRPASSSR